MLKRGDIVWADLGGQRGRRPVCVLTRDAAIPVLTRLACAEITRTIRGIRTEVEIGTVEGLLHDCAISCDNLSTVRKTRLDARPVGRLAPEGRRRLDAALAHALDIEPGSVR